MSEHTAGPWIWVGDSFDDVLPHLCPHESEWGDHGPDLVNAAEQAVWEKYWVEHPKGGDPASMPPAPSMVLESWGYDASGLRVTAANARLIAAAPELLEALRKAFANADATLHGNHAPHHPIEVAREMRAAIAKAEGK